MCAYYQSAYADNCAVRRVALGIFHLMCHFAGFPFRPIEMIVQMISEFFEEKKTRFLTHP